MSTLLSPSVILEHVHDDGMSTTKPSPEQSKSLYYCFWVVYIGNVWGVSLTSASAFIGGKTTGAQEIFRKLGPNLLGYSLLDSSAQGKLSKMAAQGGKQILSVLTKAQLKQGKGFVLAGNVSNSFKLLSWINCTIFGDVVSTSFLTKLCLKSFAKKTPIKTMWYI